MNGPRVRTCFGGFLALALGYLLLTGVFMHLTRRGTYWEKVENRQWVASSHSWTDRQLCNWIGICGAAHLNSRAWTWTNSDEDVPSPIPDVHNYWTSGSEDPDSWSKEERARREIPDYVWRHAPYVHLFSGEDFWPCDLAEHLVHTSPYVNYTKIEDREADANLTNLNELNHFRGGHSGRFIYLQSDDNVEEHPSWLGGAKNIPTTPKRGDDKYDDDDDDNDDAPWPSLDDLKGFDLDAIKQATLAEYDAGHNERMDDTYWTLPAMTPSENGRCGGGSGFSCRDSPFGQCCSIYGWCGSDDSYCGDACDPTAGACRDPFEPLTPPHPDLRRRKRSATPPRPVSLPVGKSTAPAFLIVVPKPDGVLDAFWFFFYSFNLGQKVLNIRFGNHVGDWEHTMIRFKHGHPEEVFLSEHNFGDAYAWHALEKYLPDPASSGDRMLGSWSNASAAVRHAARPVVYSAKGSHAMYATPGLHPYILPWGILHDQTDRGPLWDPTLNAMSYVYLLNSSSSFSSSAAASPALKAASAGSLLASTANPRAPTEWFHFAGHWGDKFYPLSDPRQYRFAGQYHYVNGPTGPKYKNLARQKVCQGQGRCNIKNWVGEANRSGRWKGGLPEEGEEEGGLPGGNITGLPLVD